MKTSMLHAVWGRFVVMMAALVSLLALPASAALVPASVTTTGSSVTTNILSDQSTVVKFLADGTFTIPPGATGRLLLVGGGGAGGNDCAGGGGGGGMIEASSVVFSAGTYTVTVGAGGQPNASNSQPGGDGGNTVLTGPGLDLTAVGGGGGGGWNNRDGRPGGSGGNIIRSEIHTILQVPVFFNRTVFVHHDRYTF